MAIASNHRVLVVTAREAAARELKAVLDLAGYENRWAGSGEEALGMVRGWRPDIVLVDEGLPEVSAGDVCRAVRSDPDAVVSILLLGEKEGAGIAGDPGVAADDFVSLPIRAAEAGTRVRLAVERNLLRRRSREDAARIRELEQVRDELTQLIARDMKAPLTGLADLLEMADRESVKHFKAGASQYLNEALDATETLEEMVAFLTDVRRMLSGAMTLERRRCDVTAMIRDIAELLGESAAASGVKVEVEGGPVTLACDTALAGRALRHVLRTAILACRRGGVIRVGILDDGGKARIQVRCAGRPGGETQGLAAGGGSGRMCSPSGLGMTFCRLAMEAHGGSFAVDSGEGCRWSLLLPGGPETQGRSAVPETPAAAAGIPLQKSRRYLNREPSLPGAGPGRGLALGTTRYQFSVAVAIMSAIPLLAFGYLFMETLLGHPVKPGSLLLITVSSVALVLLGIALLLRHVAEVNRLRRYLERMAGGKGPGGGVRTSGADFVAMARALGVMMERADEKVRTIEEESRSRLLTEQQRVMAETVGAACHHLGQPATVIGVYLDLMKRKESSPEMQRLIAECQLAATDVSGILHRLQGVGRYETEPYLTSRQGGGSRNDERILKI